MVGGGPTYTSDLSTILLSGTSVIASIGQKAFPESAVYESAVVLYVLSFTMGFVTGITGEVGFRLYRSVLPVGLTL